MFSQTVFVVASTLLAGAQAICSHNTHLFERASGPSFSYTGLTGPLNWHSLNVNNTKCAKGIQQTPINLDGGITQKSGSEFVIRYPHTHTAKFENLGTTVEVLGDSIGGNLTFSGKTYHLKQFHFHTPSEHRIDEEHYPMEVHFVHAADGLCSTRAIIAFEANKMPR
jgi:carbonic anhydrase